MGLINCQRVWWQWAKKRPVFVFDSCSFGRKFNLLGTHIWKRQLCLAPFLVLQWHLLFWWCTASKKFIFTSEPCIASWWQTWNNPLILNMVRRLLLSVWSLVFHIITFKIKALSKWLLLKHRLLESLLMKCLKIKITTGIIITIKQGKTNDVIHSNAFKAQQKHYT